MRYWRADVWTVNHTYACARRVDFAEGPLSGRDVSEDDDAVRGG